MNTATLNVTGTDGIFEDDHVFFETSPLRWWAKYKQLSSLLTQIGFSRAGGKPSLQEFKVIEVNESSLVIEQVIKV
jgi:hypothetical protein